MVQEFRRIRDLLPDLRQKSGAAITILQNDPIDMWTKHCEQFLAVGVFKGLRRCQARNLDPNPGQLISLDRWKPWILKCSRDGVFPHILCKRLMGFKCPDATAQDHLYGERDE